MILCARFAVGHETNSAFASAGDAKSGDGAGKRVAESRAFASLCYNFFSLFRGAGHWTAELSANERAYIVVAAIFQHLIAWLENWIDKNGTEWRWKEKQISNQR